jgi:5'(3')-deoxyribonucleotidase
MLSPHEVAFDIDGVFADTMGLFLRIVRRQYGINHIQYNDINRYYLEECLDIDPGIISEVIHRILDGDYQDELQPIDGSRRVLTAIGTKAPLLFVTARPSAHAIEDWVTHMLPNVGSPIEVIATGAYEAKSEVLKERDIRYFVEDSLDACRWLERQGIIPILFRQPWNRFPHPFHEVEDWAEIEGLIDLPYL